MADRHNTPMTLRQLCKDLGPDFLDVPIRFMVLDAHQHADHALQPSMDWQGFHRTAADPSINYPGELRFTVYLKKHRLVKEREA